VAGRRRPSESQRVTAHGTHEAAGADDRYDPVLAGPADVGDTAVDTRRLARIVGGEVGVDGQPPVVVLPVMRAVRLGVAGAVRQSLSCQPGMTLCTSSTMGSPGSRPTSWRIGISVSPNLSKAF
jgi:hypothetical protein